VDKPKPSPRPLRAEKRPEPAAIPITVKDGRTAAWVALGRVLTGGAYATLALDAELTAGKVTDTREVALAHEILLGTLRYLPQLDRALTTITNLNLKTIPARIVDLLRISVYQLLHLKRVPAYAIVNEAAKRTADAGFPRLVGMVNAVLRKIEENRPAPFNPSGDELDDLEEETALPRWLASRWLKQFGYAEARKLGQTLLKPAILTLRVNTTKTTVEEMTELLTKLGYQVTAGAPGLPTVRLAKATGITRTTLYIDGYFYLQDESTLLAPIVLAPPPGARVLDLCAGLGGKSTFMAQLMQNQGEIVAVDQNAEKLRLLEENARRMGFGIIQPLQADILAADIPSADYVLLDCPCSNLGTVRHRPELKWSTKPTALPSIVRLEKALLEKAAVLTNPGGWLVYSTCTMELEEDEEVVQAFLSDHSDFKVIDVVERLPRELVETWELEGPFVRTYPHRHDVDGAFVALLRREA
jgi:16S rRNA (cytosine967-C5)-methyltransferase